MYYLAIEENNIGPDRVARCAKQKESPSSPVDRKWSLSFFYFFFRTKGGVRDTTERIIICASKLSQLLSRLGQPNTISLSANRHFRLCAANCGVWFIFQDRRSAGPFSAIPRSSAKNFTKYMK